MPSSVLPGLSNCSTMMSPRTSYTSSGIAILSNCSTMMCKEGGHVDWCIDSRMGREQGVKNVEKGGRGTSLRMRRFDYSLHLSETGWDQGTHG